MVEKRAYKRSPIELAASYGIGEDSRPERRAKIRNMSCDGFCFTSHNRLRVGEEIQVAIDLDTVEEVIVAVKVVWIEKIENSGRHTVGVQVIEKEGPDFERFAEFYRQL